MKTTLRLAGGLVRFDDLKGVDYGHACYHGMGAVHFSLLDHPTEQALRPSISNGIRIKLELRRGP